MPDKRFVPVLNATIPADLQRVLPEVARQKARDMASDPVQARAFLLRAGIITRNGRLARAYR
ncbi:MAG TPA: hypothetical protein DCS21_10190 [Gammaproteobacteria bacterium]|nr:hypothetical protein [Gammaproteobacteria bacterium]